jgi:hypothetical protein
VGCFHLSVCLGVKCGERLVPAQVPACISAKDIRKNSGADELGSQDGGSWSCPESDAFLKPEKEIADHVSPGQ